MDNIQNQVDDFLESSNEKVIRQAMINLGREYKGDGYGIVYDDALRNEMEKVRQDILNQMNFDQEYKRQRHIGQLDEAQRDLDRFKHNSEEEKMYQQLRTQERIYYSESRLIEDDLDRINIKDIVNHYRDIAEKYNEQDKNEVYHIIEETMKNPSLLLADRTGQRSLISDPNSISQVNNMIYDSIINEKNISCNEIEKFISNDNMKQEFSQYAQEHYNEINIRDLLDRLVENRIKTLKGIVDVAPSDIETRTTGINQKMDTINNIKHTGIASENYYEEQINREQARKEQLEEESKKAFLEARDSQRVVDDNIRKQQMAAIQNLSNEELIDQSKGVSR